MLRYNDNFNYLKIDSVHKKGTERLKFISLGSACNVSLGGEMRAQMQYYRNFNFGDLPSAPNQPRTSQLWHRAMVHSSIEIGKKFRLFAQLGSTFRFLNPNSPVPEIDENHLSLHQLFGEYRFNRKWMARVGRQEMSYGSHRIITFREGPNTRLTFDATVIKYNSEKRKLDLIALSPVVSRKGMFDDAAFKDFIIGVYATEILLPKKLMLDYYFLNFESSRRKYSYQEGFESRRVAGFRAFSQNRILNYETELTYQFGSFNNLRVSAYGLFADVNFSLLPRVNLVLGTAGNYVSGDRSKGDNRLNTYNTLFSKPQYGLTAPIGASNVITFNPYLRVNPVRRSSIYAGAYAIWRQSNQDGSYTPDGTLIRPRPEKVSIATDRRLGTLVSLETSYSVSKHLSFAFDASHFFAGKFMVQTGRGKDITYLSLKAGYKF